MPTTYSDGRGNAISRDDYYAGMVVIAQERQRAFPRWSGARRRWKRAEREYRQALSASNSPQVTP